MNIYDMSAEEIETFKIDAKRRLVKIKKDLYEMQGRYYDVVRRRNVIFDRSGVGTIITISGIYDLRFKRVRVQVLNGDKGKAYNLVSQVIKIRDVLDPHYVEKRKVWREERNKILASRRGWGGPW